MCQTAWFATYEAALDTVYLRGLTFHGHHGVLPEVRVWAEGQE